MIPQSKLYNLVSQIPSGKVMTYGSLARYSKIKNPRIVGNYLHKNTDPEKIPCHRVVNHKGELSKNYAFGGAIIQRKKLEREGVFFTGDRVDLTRSVLVSI